MVSPDEVIAAFGGLVKTQRALGHKHASTVFGWKKNNKVPHWRYPEILAAARKEGVVDKLPAAIRGADREAA